MSGAVAFTDGRKMPVYIDSEIDDSGMDVYERAVYLTIARRSGKDSAFYESIGNMAARLGIGTTKAREALRSLEAYGVIARMEHAGETSEYVLTDRSVGWRLPASRPTPQGKRTPTPRVEVPQRQTLGGATPGVAKGTPLKDLPVNTSQEQDLKPLSAVPTSTKLEPGVQHQFLALWNEHRGPLPKALGPNSKRANAIKTLVKEYGLADARELFVQATQQVASDPFWAEKNLNIDNLLVRGRVAEKAEKQAAGPGKPKRTNGAAAPDDFTARGPDYYQPMTGNEWLNGKRAT